MSNWQIPVGALPDPLSAEVVGADDLRLAIAGEHVARFRVWKVASLTDDVAAEARSRASREPRHPLLVVYDRSSPTARDALREAGLSYIGADGRVLLQAPPLFVDRDRAVRRAATPSTAWATATAETLARNPFAVQSSRLARWLLLHANQSFGIVELAAHLDLSPAAVSRAVRALDELALVEVAAEGRRREVRLRRARALLDAWLPDWQRRRLRRATWDVGADDVHEAVRIVADAAEETGVRWALGGLAGAGRLSQAVEPADALVWISADDLAVLAEPLMPRRVRGGRATVRVTAAPDPWTLSLATATDGLPVADPVQLWLDCSSEGERALEAADAVARAMGWS